MSDTIDIRITECFSPFNTCPWLSFPAVNPPKSASTMDRSNSRDLYPSSDMASLRNLVGSMAIGRKKL